MQTWQENRTLINNMGCFAFGLAVILACFRRHLDLVLSNPSITSLNKHLATNKPIVS